MAVYTKVAESDIDQSRAVHLFQGCKQAHPTLFGHFKNEEFDLLSKVLTLRYLRPGEVVHRSGVKATFCGIVLCGHFKCIFNDKVAIKSQGSLFGEIALLEGGYRCSDMVAREDSVLAVITFEEFKTLVQIDPNLHGKLWALFSLGLLQHLRTLVGSSQSHRTAGGGGAGSDVASHDSGGGGGGGGGDISVGIDDGGGGDDIGGVGGVGGYASGASENLVVAEVEGTPAMSTLPSKSKGSASVGKEFHHLEDFYKNLIAAQCSQTKQAVVTEHHQLLKLKSRENERKKEVEILRHSAEHMHKELQYLTIQYKEAHAQASDTIQHLSTQLSHATDRIAMFESRAESERRAKINVETQFQTLIDRLKQRGDMNKNDALSDDVPPVMDPNHEEEDASSFQHYDKDELIELIVGSKRKLRAVQKDFAQQVEETHRAELEKDSAKEDFDKMELLETKACKEARAFEKLLKNVAIKTYVTNFRTKRQMTTMYQLVSDMVIDLIETHFNGSSKDLSSYLATEDTPSVRDRMDLDDLKREKAKQLRDLIGLGCGASAVNKVLCRVGEELSVCQKLLVDLKSRVGHYRDTADSFLARALEHTTRLNATRLQLAKARHESAVLQEKCVNMKEEKIRKNARERREMKKTKDVETGERRTDLSKGLSSQRVPGLSRNLVSKLELEVESLNVRKFKLQQELIELESSKANKMRIVVEDAETMKLHKMNAILNGTSPRQVGRSPYADNQKKVKRWFPNVGHIGQNGHFTGRGHANYRGSPSYTYNPSQGPLSSELPRTAAGTERPKHYNNNIVGGEPKTSHSERPKHAGGHGGRKRGMTARTQRKSPRFPGNRPPGTADHYARNPRPGGRSGRKPSTVRSKRRVVSNGGLNVPNDKAKRALPNLPVPVDEGMEENE